LRSAQSMGAPSICLGNPRALGLTMWAHTRTRRSG
jgi:hypothetical protein